MSYTFCGALGRAEYRQQRQRMRTKERAAAISQEQVRRLGAKLDAIGWSDEGMARYYEPFLRATEADDAANSALYLAQIHADNLYEGRRA